MRQDREKLILGTASYFSFFTGGTLPGQKLFALFLGAPLLGNIASDLRSADYLPPGVSNGRDRQRDMNPLAVFGYANCFVVIDPFATSEFLQNRGFFIGALRRYQD